MYQEVLQKMVRPNWRFILLMLLLVSSRVNAWAEMFVILEPRVKIGHVMARTVVRDEDGEPILVEYNDAGEEVGVIQYPTPSEAVLMAADAYRTELKKLRSFQSEHAEGLAKGARILSRDAYYAESFLAADNQTTIEQIPLPAWVKSVLVRPQVHRILPSPNELVLLSFSVDFSSAQGELPAGISTLVMTPKGQIYSQHRGAVGYRAGFYGTSIDQPQSAEGTNRQNYDKDKHQLFGPMPGILVDTGPLDFFDSSGFTDEDGQFVLRKILLFCPFYGMEYPGWITATLHYQGFTPIGGRVLPYHIMRWDYDMCGCMPTGYTPVGYSACVAWDWPPVYKYQLYVDVMMLSGLVGIYNPDGSTVSIGDSTQYSAHSPDTTPISQLLYDFDKDGQPDPTALGIIVEEEINGETVERFTTELDGAEPTVQGVWFSSNGPASGAPDLVRLADTRLDFSGTGFLTSISRADLVNTDIMVFRESTGDLVLHRKGLEQRSDTGLIDNQFYYRLRLRGPQDYMTSSSGLRAGQFEEWAAKNYIKESYQQRKSNHLKSGEWVRLVMINRPTGYMATARVQLSAGSDNVAGSLSVPVPHMTMRPPNLKIWAERKYTVEQGLTAGTDRNYLIGSEGAGLTSDDEVVVYTEWFDADGQPLPAGLGDDNGEMYGLTGRLAKVVAPNLLGEASGSGLANFAIAPGRQTQVLKLKGDNEPPEHFYIHVSGTAKDEGPDFAATGAGPGNMTSRPAHLTPFKAPLPNETTDNYRWLIYNQLKKAYEEAEDKQGLLEPEAPQSSHVFSYRPEYQFSRYSFNIHDASYQAGGEGSLEELLKGDGSVIDTMSELVEVMYSLVLGVQERLAPLDSEQTIVMSLGGNEVELSISEGGQVSFDNINALVAASGTDLLALQLYLNEDVSNILWEAEFAATPELIPDSAYLNADHPQKDLLLNFPTFSGSEGRRIVIDWAVEGSGALAHERTESIDGLALNTLSMPSKAGSTAYITAEVVSSNDAGVIIGSTKRFGPFEVIAGVPALIDVAASADSLVTDDTSTARMTAYIRDAAGNEVADGSYVGWALDGSGDLTSEELLTSEGKASAIYRVGKETSSSTVQVLAAKTPELILFNKQTLTVDLSATKREVLAGSGETISLTATLNQNVADPVAIEWSSTLGVLSAPAEIVGNTATATLRASDFPGSGIVTVNVAGSISRILIEHKGTPSTGIELDYAAIAANDGSPTQSVETLFGTSSHTVATQTSATVYGEPGKRMRIRAGGFFSANAKPVVNLGMNEVVEDSVSGERFLWNFGSSTKALVEGDVVSDSYHSYTTPGTSIHMQGGRISIYANPSHDIQNNLFLNLRIRPESGAPESVLVRKGSEDKYNYEISLIPVESEYRVRLVLHTGTGPVELASNDTIAAEQWSIIGLRVGHGTVELAVNSDRRSSLISGLMEPLGISGGIVLGDGYLGHIDEFRLGAETASTALVVFSNGESTQDVELGADGTAKVFIHSTANMPDIGQRVGFTAQSLGDDIVMDAPSSSELPLIKRIFSPYIDLFGVKVAVADEVDISAVSTYEDGLTVVPPSQFAQTMELLSKLGDQAWSLIKGAATLLYEISGLSDVYTIGKALFLLFNGRWSEVDKFDLVFAGIGLTLSIVAIVTSPTGVGTAGALSLKAAMKGLKLLLKELISDPMTLIKAGGAAVNWTFRLIKDLFAGRVGLVRKQLAEVAELFIHMIKNARDGTLSLFVTTVRSIKDFRNFLRAFRGAKGGTACFAARQHAPLYYARLSPLLSSDFIGAAYASGACPVNIEFFANLRNKVLESSYFGGDKLRAGAAAKHVLDIAGDLMQYGVELSPSSLEKLAKLVDKGYADPLRAMLENAKNPANGAMRDFILREGTEGVGFAKVIDEASQKNVMDGLLDALDNLPDRASGIDVDAFLKGLETRNDTAIKGVYGELAALKSVKEVEGFEGAVLESMTDWVVMTRELKGIQSEQKVLGIDQVYKLGATKLFVESKNLKNYLSKVGRRKQLEKHLEYNVLGELTEGRIPKLHYELRGRRFTPQHVEETILPDLVDNCKKFMGKPEYIALLTDLRKSPFGLCSEMISVKGYPEILEPLVQ